MEERIYTIHHYPQRKPWGCLYHAVAALLGEEWLAHVDDVSNIRRDLRLMRAGYIIDAVYENQFEPATADFWERWGRANAGLGAFRALLGCQWGGGVTSHSVAALIVPGGETFVSDSLREEGVLAFDWEVFCRSVYARTFRAHILMDGDLALYPPEEPYGEAYQERRAFLEREAARPC